MFVFPNLHCCFNQLLLCGFMAVLVFIMPRCWTTAGAILDIFFLCLMCCWLNSYCIIYIWYKNMVQCVWNWWAECSVNMNAFLAQCKSTLWCGCEKIDLQQWYFSETNQLNSREVLCGRHASRSDWVDRRNNGGVCGHPVPSVSAHGEGRRWWSSQ